MMAPAGLSFSRMSDRTHVVIAGGGVTGLAIGYFLARAGVPHVILEAQRRPGGVIRSARVDGHLLEWGPQRTRLTSTVSELIGDLGITDQVITAPSGLPLYVYWKGKLREVPFSVGAFLLSDIVPLTAKLKLLLEPFQPPARDEESVAEFFTRHLGRAIYENVAGPLYGGLYASDPANMQVGLSLRHVLNEFRIERSLVLAFLKRGGGVSPPPACSFVEGMQTLPWALYAANEPNIHLETAAYSIVREGGEWEVDTECGQVRAPHVVLTSSASATADLLQRVAPRPANALRRLVYNPLAVVHLHAETDLQGLGFQVSLAERLATRGVTFNDSLFARKGVYTAYLGGAKAPEVVGWRDQELGAVAVREFRQMTGFDATPISIEREAMPAWDVSWKALAEVQLPDGLHLAANWQARPGIPGRLAQAKSLASRLAATL
jgi:protoporphyrinogen/coproporphyrinogen III oxidase